MLNAMGKNSRCNKATIAYNMASLVFFIRRTACVLDWKEEER